MKSKITGKDEIKRSGLEKKTIGSYLKKSIIIHNIVKRFAQFGISIIISNAIYTLLEDYGQIKVVSGFVFFFMLNRLNSLFFPKTIEI